MAMENFKPSSKRDKQILTHIRWGSKQIPRITKKIFEDLYFDQFPDAKSIVEAIPDKVAHKSFTVSPRLIEPFTKYGITSSIHLWISVEEEGNIEELKDYSGILFHIYFGDNLPTYGAFIQPRPSRDKESALDRKTGEKIRPNLWKKREWDGLTRILYRWYDTHPHKPIDLFIQIGIDLIKRGFLTDVDCIFKDFKKYIFTKNPKQCPKDNFVLKKALKTIVNSYLISFNTTTFEAYSKRTTSALLRHRTTYRYKPKIYSEEEQNRKDIRQFIIRMRMQEKGCSKETAKRWLSRKLKMYSLDEIYINELWRDRKPKSQ
jgi:hypothetical protein